MFPNECYSKFSGVISLESLADITRTKQTPPTDPCQGRALSFVIKSSPANPIVSFLDLLLHARVKVISQ